MTQEEAISVLERIKVLNEKWSWTESTVEALDMAINALSPITREQVEKMRGRWNSYLNGNYNDEVYYCNVCGHDLDSMSGAQNFCPECGNPKTEDAVNILWRELKEIQDAD